MPRISRLTAAVKLLAVLTSIGLSSVSSSTTRTMRAADGFSIIPGSNVPPPGPDSFTILDDTPSPSPTQPSASTIPPAVVALPTPTPTKTPALVTTKPPKTSAAPTPKTPAPSLAVVPTKKPLVAKVTKKKRFRRHLQSVDAPVSVWLEDAE